MIYTMLSKHSFFALILVIAFATACDTSAPEPEYFTKVELFLDLEEGIPGGRIIDDIDKSDRVYAAFERLETPELADALIRAHDRGADVKIVGDEDAQSDVGFQALLDADVPVTFGNGELAYLPDPTLNSIVDNCGQLAEKVRCPPPQGSEPVPAGLMYRPGSYNVMSHSFLLTGKTTVWNFANSAFGATDGPMVGYRIESERMWEVFEREHRQLFGGVFATTLDVYNGPVKSAQQSNPDFNSESYLSELGEFQTFFSPQDRVTKKIIDESYRARASVWIITDNMAEDALAKALQYKQEYFDVKVITNRAAQASELDWQDIPHRFAPDSIDKLPTVVVIDGVEDREGDRRPRRVMVSSYPIYKTGPFRIFFGPPVIQDDIIEIYPSDYFIDGNLWGLIEYRGQVWDVKEIDQFVDQFETLWSQSEAP